VSHFLSSVAAFAEGVRARLLPDFAMVGATMTQNAPAFGDALGRAARSGLSDLPGGDD
jgi:hypothetical protein